ncbi:formyltetrahydrofolate deformylase [Piscinibacter sakaiensis]|uniref:formyltetrahydrofolate deformylase n=1 Tax=Piscinibacter sakaiensis TaxID=1547922 RepID=UPI003AAA6873
MSDRIILTTACRNRPGIVAALSTAILEMDCNILDSQQFDDLHSDQFFGRIVFDRCDLGELDEEAVRAQLQPVFERFAMKTTVRLASRRRRVLLMASKFDHCLGDLMYRWRIGELEMDVVGVVSNSPAETYRHLSPLGVPFHHLPVTAETKPAQEAKLLEIIEANGVELVVLARYMQILSDELTRRLAGRCINIHHSFLPGFKGARPYHQAFDRGVKVIGATAHYVTADLDEGPIIEQDIERVSHRDQPDELVRKGRDIERRVLARAVRHHLEDRVLLNGNKTIVFPE